MRGSPRGPKVMSHASLILLQHREYSKCHTEGESGEQNRITKPSLAGWFGTTPLDHPGTASVIR